MQSDFHHGLLLVLCGIAVVACDRKTPPPPVIEPPAASQTINGTERLGWDQPAADAVELATIGYAIYVDGARALLAGVSCAPTASATTPAGFACSARLPSLSAGSHTLQLASFVTDDPALESARSAALRVTVVPAVTLVSAVQGGVPAVQAGGPAAQAFGRANVPAAPGVDPSTPMTIATTGRARMRVEPVADGLDHPTDLAFAPDGRLFIAERSGRIRIVRDGHLLPDAAASPVETVGGDGTLLALALDPQFDRTRFVFAIHASPSRSGASMFCLSRFREASDTLADRVVLLDGIGASPEPTASLRFGADSKLYAALDAGGDVQRRGDRASPNGKILRVNADGTTPSDQAGSTPIYSDGSRLPAGFDWDPRGEGTGTLWIADRDPAGSSRLRAVGPDPGVRAGEKRGIVRGTYALPASTTPSSVAFYRGGLFPAFAGSLLVASEDGRHLLRISLEARPSNAPQASGRPASRGTPCEFRPFFAGGAGLLGACSHFSDTLLGDSSPMDASGRAGINSVPGTTERLLENRVGGLRVVAVGPEGAIYFGTASAIGRLTPDVQ